MLHTTFILHNQKKNEFGIDVDFVSVFNVINCIFVCSSVKQEALDNTEIIDLVLVDARETFCHLIIKIWTHRA